MRDFPTIIDRGRVDKQVPSIILMVALQRGIASMLFELKEEDRMVMMMPIGYSFIS